MNPDGKGCPNENCPDYGKKTEGNIGIHSQQSKRYKCKTCGHTFSQTHSTAKYRLKKSHELFTLVITLLVHGCPLQAIVAAFGLDARTVRAWWARSGQQSERVHDTLVGQSHLDLGQVQADEIRVKTQQGIIWMAFAVMVSTRLWLGGAISPRRDTALIEQLVSQIRAIAQFRPLLLAVDGLTTYITAFRKAFRFPAQTGKGRCWRLEPWPHLTMVQVIKAGWQEGTFYIERRIVRGTGIIVAALLKSTQGGGQINTAYIERLNATFRQRLSCLGRRTRALARRQGTLQASMYLLGGVYNFCTYHASLTQRLAGSLQEQRTPAMAAGLTDHRWTVDEFLSYQVFKPPSKAVLNLPRKLQKYAIRDFAA